MINFSALDPMEAHRMLIEERRQWATKEEMLRDHMDQQWHWGQNEIEYDQQLRAYYQQRAHHQQQCVRLNQILYGIEHPSTSMQHSGYPSTAPPPAQPMTISPIPAPRNPLQPQEHHNINMKAASAAFKQKKKRAAEHGDEPSSWEIQSHERMAKRHHL
ncbi:hypothetical protein Ndes2526B_g04114 [Nannochloris sp. 'desiccata']